jgi:predicted ATP-grasp superfamily ATP-dependent carboligase
MGSGYGDIDQPCAIIIGLDSLQGLQAARILAERRVPVIAIAKDPKYHSCRTRVCKEIIFTNTENEQLIGTLEDLGRRLSEKAVIFPCQEISILLVSRNREKLKEWYHIVLPSPDVVEMMMDKGRFYEYAEKENLPIPRTFIFETRDEAEKAAQELSYPSIVKPSMKYSHWLQNTMIKGFKVSNAEQLLDVYDGYKMWADALIAQEWIEGPDTNHYTCHCYFNAKSEPIVTFTSIKLRQWPPGTGQRCLGQECRNDIVLDQTVRLFQSVNFRGLAYLEMKRDEGSGLYFIIEPNIGRPTGSSTLAEAAGVEILYTMYCDNIGIPLPKKLEQKYLSVKWLHLLRDTQAAVYHWRRGELTVTDWWRSWKGPKTYALFSWRDPAPFVSAVKRSIPIMLSGGNHSGGQAKGKRRDR